MGERVWAEIKEILREFQTGIRTELEVVSAMFVILEGNMNLEVWKALPNYVQDKIRKRLIDFTEQEETISFGGRSAESVKDGLRRLKDWAIATAII